MRLPFGRIAPAAAALAFILATPAEAAKASKHKTQASKPTVSKQRVRLPPVRPPASNDVYFQGHYLGTDPDPNIRHQIGRDLGIYFGGDD